MLQDHKRHFHFHTHTYAFTLIELLIVIAIIAILALIAVPNFLEAQTRAKVARVLSDYTSLKTAQETYMIDYGVYVPDQYDPAAGDVESFNRMTTPIAYMTIVPTSPFEASNNPYNTGDKYMRSLYNYGANLRFTNSGLVDGWPPDMRAAGLQYWILCAGPDNYFVLRDYAAWGDADGVWVDLDAGRRHLNILYNPTNGTVSRGDILMSNKRIYGQQ